MKRFYDWFFKEPPPTDEQLEMLGRVTRIAELATAYNTLLVELGREPSTNEVWKEAGIK